MNERRQLVLGTHNRKKGRELAHLLAPYGFELRTLADYPEAIEVIENGDSFAANAAAKASEQARHLGSWVLGEDSGLIVDALDGAPGIFSARYSGPHATDESNNRLLLEQLGNTSPAQRTAAYVCHMCVSDPFGQIRVECQANCRGRIRDRPVGDAGFGYDPLFEIVEFHRTFAELGEQVKSLLSHRARAMRLLLPRLLHLTRTVDW